MSKFLLCEDAKGGYDFWKKVNELLLDNYFDVVDTAEVSHYKFEPFR